MKYFLVTALNVAILSAGNYYYEFGKKVELEENKSSRSLNNNISEYKTKDGKNLSFNKDEIIVQCNKDSYCEDDFEDLKLTQVEKLSTNFYLVKLNKDQNIFKISQELYRKDDIKSAHPNYIMKRELR